MDTLCCSYDGSPSHHTTKFTYVPHIRTIIAGTGLGNFSTEWALPIVGAALTLGIEHLDEFASEQLSLLWAERKQKDRLPPELTTTVYHFGISETTGKVVNIAYRSEDDFVSEKLSYGLAVKPYCEPPVGDYDFYEMVPGLMDKQRIFQEERPMGERLYIGGEILACYLNADYFKSWSLGKFSDFDTQTKKMFSNFEENN